MQALDTIHKHPMQPAHPCHDGSRHHDTASRHSAESKNSQDFYAHLLTGNWKASKSTLLTQMRNIVRNIVQEELGKASTSNMLELLGGDQRNRLLHNVIEE